VPHRIGGALETRCNMLARGKRGTNVAEPGSPMDRFGLSCALFVSLVPAVGHAEPSRQRTCLDFATGVAEGGAFPGGGDTDAYSETRGASIQFQADLLYCALRNVSFGGGLHYWHGFETDGYDFFSVDGIIEAHGRIGRVDVGLRGGPGILTFLKPHTTTGGYTVPPSTFVAFTPFVGPAFTYWVGENVGLLVLGDLRLNSVAVGQERYRLAAVGGSLGAAVRW
jgi:hypothetical protein